MNAEFYPFGCNVTGIDYSPRMIELALEKQQKGLNYKLMDVHNLEYPDNSFDCVVDTFGLEYYADPETALSEMKRVTKEGGLMLLLNSGLPEGKYLQKYTLWMLPMFFLKNGYFSTRKWDSLAQKLDMEEILAKKFNGGSLYMNILMKPYSENVARKSK